MTNSIVLGTGSYAPQRVPSNADLEKIVRTNNEWIVSRTGIKERRVAADHEATSDLAAAAGREALRFAGVKPDDVDMIIVCTVTGDAPTPSCASFVQAQLGAKNAFAFDVGAACAGSLFGLSIADQFIRSGKVKRALVSVSDKTGLIEFCRGLYELGVEIISTSGTAKALREAGIEVRSLDTVTGYPE
ncbi:MAG: hypothetical protein HZC06_12220, partial [Methylocystis sp.]|nr:hypothetical protein [Methylocystis sp.]